MFGGGQIRDIDVDLFYEAKVIHKKEDQGDVDSGCYNRHIALREVMSLITLIGDFKEFAWRICDWGHPQKEDQGYVDSGCSRHMIGNMSYLSDFKEFDGGYVLLKVPRKNNMYSVDMKNIIPKESLTCLVAKATLDELMLWHKRLGHVNFKTINKLIKDNLVRGLPLKCFENDQTYVACRKGKQHKASSSKDETSGILKSFITEIENLVDKKVKIIRCDNETEFKNRVMSDFCKKKGIKREFSIASTLQQNGVAERRNKTLIEAARIMLADSKLPTTF
ncbi:ribonuclease H-like domain-containing protein [Tanacetum coccineum]